jgi:hypothetical protein
MNLPQIRQGRMVLKGTQFPLLQPLAEQGTPNIPQLTHSFTTKALHL